MSGSNVHLTVATVIERNGQFLMVRELDGGKEVYNQPAGHWEPGETLRQAALRETLEETGWVVELSAFLGIFMSSSEHGGTYCRIAFVAEPLQPKPDAQLDPDIIAAEWLSAPELEALHDKMRSALVMRTLDTYNAGQRFDLSAVDALLMPHSA